MDNATVFCFTIIIAGLITTTETRKLYDRLQAIIVTSFSISVLFGNHPLPFFLLWGLKSIGTDINGITGKEVNCPPEIFPACNKPSKFFIVKAFTGSAVILILQLMLFTAVPVPNIRGVNQELLARVGI
ncbi:hypothetical protein BJ878DRAFT_476333 [Calycina marina]|uniref:Uncharacterized protein n=1 Tax=Calycina marina TaxID=1763456 RepID=A0A9P8CIP0_9HELO|nr:hypothetical protein BJ878DRAFT_476333 [Calycina marina]